jgi:hypothetical protein
MSLRFFKILFWFWGINPNLKLTLDDLEKYKQQFFLVTIFYHEGCMLISQTVDIKIHENLHLFLMGVKLWTQFSQKP